METEGLSLDDVLDGKTELESVDETAEELEQPSGDESVEETTEESPEDTTTEEEQKVPAGALVEERGKRQELQRELDDLRLKLAQQATPEKSDETDVDIDLLDDPDGYRDQLRSEVKNLVKDAEANMQKQFLGLVEGAARARHEDYDDILPYFTEAAQQNRQLAVDAAQAGDPAEFAYQTGLKLKRLADGGGDLDALIKSEREAAVKEYLENNPPEAEEDLKVPKSLSKQTAASGAAAPKDPGDPSLQELFDN